MVYICIHVLKIRTKSENFLLIICKKDVIEIYNSL